MLKLCSYDMYEKSIHRNLESNIVQNLQQFNVYQTFCKPPVAGSWSASPVKKHMNMSCRAMSKHLSTPRVWYDSCQPLSRLQCWNKCGEDGGWFLRMYNSICKCVLLDYNSASWIYTKTSKYWIVQNVPCFIPFFFSLSERKENGFHCHDSMEGAKPRLYCTTVISNDHTFKGIFDRDPICLMQNRYCTTPRG